MIINLSVVTLATELLTTSFFKENNIESTFIRREVPHRGSWCPNQLFLSETTLLKKKKKENKDETHKPLLQQFSFSPDTQKEVLKTILWLNKTFHYRFAHNVHNLLLSIFYKIKPFLFSVKHKVLHHFGLAQIVMTVWVSWVAFSVVSPFVH